jgi:hypothetical protein
LASVTGENGRRLGPVERQESRDPAIRNAEPVEVVENAGGSDGRKSEHRDGAKPAAADCGRQTADEGLIAQDRIEIGRNIRHANAMALGRDASVEIGQGFFVVERTNLGQNRSEEVDRPIGLLDKPVAMVAIGRGTP